MEQNKEDPGTWVNGTGLQTHIPDKQTVTTRKYAVQYGKRVDDGAVVFHFFPANHAWDLAYEMPRRLEDSIKKHLSRFPVHTSFIEELNSFCVIAAIGSSLDPELLTTRFLNEIVVWSPPAAS